MTTIDDADDIVGDVTALTDEMIFPFPPSFDDVAEEREYRKKMLVDALPHAWNMLCELAGSGELQQLDIQREDDTRMLVTGVYSGTSGATEFRFGLQQCPEQPRPLVVRSDVFGPGEPQLGLDLNDLRHGSTVPRPLASG